MNPLLRSTAEPTPILEMGIAEFIFARKTAKDIEELDRVPDFKFWLGK